MINANKKIKKQTKQLIWFIYAPFLCDFISLAFHFYFVFFLKFDESSLQQEMNSISNWNNRQSVGRIQSIDQCKPNLCETNFMIICIIASLIPVNDELMLSKAIFPGVCHLITIKFNFFLIFFINEIFFIEFLIEATLREFHISFLFRRVPR